MTTRLKTNSGLEHLGWTEIHLLTHDGSVEGMSRALSKPGGPELANKQATDGKTPLHLALMRSAANGFEIVSMLLECGVDTNAADANGKTALHLCCNVGINSHFGPELVKQLIDAGADFELKDKLGNTPFLIAAQSSAVSIMDFFLKFGANISQEDSAGMNALHIAAIGNQDDGAKKACEYLISRGANIEEKTAKLRSIPDTLRHNSGEIYLGSQLLADELAKAAGNKLTARFLSEERYKVGRERRRKFKQAQSAVVRGDEESLRKYISRDTSNLVAFALGKKNITLLIESVRQDDLPIFKLLLEAGSQLSATTSTNNNVLHIAARNSSDQILSWIRMKVLMVMNGDSVSIDSGPNLSLHTLTEMLQQRNVNGKTPLAESLDESESSPIFMLSQTIGAVLRQNRSTSSDHIDMSDLSRDMAGHKLSENESKKNTKMFQWLDNLGLSHHYEGLYEDGWTDMKRIKLIDDKEELKAAGIKKPGEIKLFLKSLQKLNKEDLGKANNHYYGNHVATHSASNSTDESIQRAWSEQELESRQESQEYVAPERDFIDIPTKSVSEEEHADQVAAAAASSPELLIPYGELIILKYELGQGSYGVVHLAKWRGMDVAVKCLKKNEGSKSATTMKEVFREASMMRRVNNHYAILRLVGICEIPVGCELDNSPGAASGGVAIVTEFCSEGNLEDMLYKSSLVNKRHEISRVDVLRMAIDAAAGVLHLHRAKMIHRDLACRNLLANHNLRVFVADFGFARVKEQCREVSGYSTQVIGPIRWEAPECWRNEGRKYSEATDVYSFGMCLYEMLSGTRPWSGFGNLEVPHQVLSGQRPPLEKCMQEWVGKHGNNEIGSHIRSIVTDCWAQDPRVRPTMESVLKRLTNCLHILEQSDVQSLQISLKKLQHETEMVTDTGVSNGQSSKQLPDESASSDVSYLYTALDDQSNFLDLHNSKGSSSQLRVRSDRPSLILRIGNCRLELHRQNTFPVKDSIIKPLGFTWDPANKVWWMLVTSDKSGAAKKKYVCDELKSKLLNKSMALRIEELKDEEIDELGGYLSEPEMESLDKD